MAGKTISMHASEETARRLEHICRMEARNPSQIASAALDFYLRLPAEAHTALRHLQALGSEEDLDRASQRLWHVLLDAQYEIAERRMVAAMTVDGMDGLETENDIADEAVRLTARKSPPAPSKKSADPHPPTTRAREPRRRRSV